MINEINDNLKFDDLGSALEYLNRTGYTHEFNLHEGLIAHSSKEESFDSREVRISGFLQYEDGTGSLNNIYCLCTESGSKGYIVNTTDSEEQSKVDAFVKQLKVNKDNNIYDIHDVNSR